MSRLATPVTPVSWRRDLLWLALVFGACGLLWLGRMPLANPDEARYAEIPREMLAAGDWVTPRLNGIVYFEKPPLVYWLVGACRVAFGASEFSARLTPAFFAVLGVLLAYGTARQLYGRAAGIASAVVLGTSGLYFLLSRVLLLDMAVSVLMSAALFCFMLGVREPAGARRRGFFYGVYAAAALATLAKGLIGFLIPGAVMFLWLLLLNQWHRLRPLYLPSGAALFLAVAAPWHVLAAQRNPEWAQFYFVHEHWARFTTTAHDRAAPWWYFVPVLLLGAFPWTGFALAAFRDALVGGWARRKEQAEAWFFALWIAFVFLFFSKSQSKLIPYLLPVFPALAVLIGRWLAQRWEQRDIRGLQLGLGVFATGCILIAVTALVAVFTSGMIRDAEQRMAVRPYAFLVAAGLLAGAIAAPWLARRKGVAAAAGAMGATVIAFFMGLLLAAPVVPRPGTKDLALVARERVAPADRVYHYWAFFHDFVYYAEREVGLVSYTDELQVQFMDPAERARRFIDEEQLRREWLGPRRVWLVVRKRDQAHPAAIFADAGFRYHLIAETRTHSLISNNP